MTIASQPLPRTSTARQGRVYAVDVDSLLLVATDRVSAFDVVMNEPIRTRARS